jgi:hypothetical protein
MFRKIFLPVLLTACLMIPATLWAGSVATTITLTGTVDQFAEWDSATQTIAAVDWSGHITAVNQSQTVSKGFVLYANDDVVLEPTAGASSGILTSGTETLTTEYQLRGDLTVPDAAYKAAGAGGGQFFAAANDYAITHVPGDGAYAVTLMARMTSPAARAPDSGDYSCGVVLTATW